MGTISFIRYYISLFLAYCKFLFAYVLFKFADYPIEIKVAAVISATCVMIILVMSLSLILMSIKQKKNSRLKERIEKKYAKGMEFIVSPEAAEILTEEQIEKAFGFDRKELNGPLLKNNREKNMFVEVFYMYFISKRSELSKTENTHTMLRMFDIPDYLEKEVSLGSTKHKVNALSKMRTFKLPISPWIINKLLNSR